jgi:hypothetical protein
MTIRGHRIRKKIFIFLGVLGALAALAQAIVKQRRATSGDIPE